MLYWNQKRPGILVMKILKYIIGFLFAIGLFLAKKEIVRLYELEYEKRKNTTS